MENKIRSGVALNYEQKVEYISDHLKFRLEMVNDLCELVLLSYYNTKKIQYKYENQCIECGLISTRTLYQLLGISHDKGGGLIQHNNTRPDDITLRSLEIKENSATLIIPEHIKQIFNCTLQEFELKCGLPLQKSHLERNLSQILQFASKSSAHFTHYQKSGITPDMYVAFVVAIGCVIDRVYAVNNLEFKTCDMFPCSLLETDIRSKHIDLIKFTAIKAAELRVIQEPTEWIESNTNK